MEITRVWIEEGCVTCGNSEEVCPEVFEIDIEADPDIAKQAGINGTPTVQLFQSKVLKAQWRGVKQRSEFKQAIESILEINK